MSLIPANTVTQEDLNTWVQLSEKLSALKSAEALLRTKIFRGLFPKPIEGTNKVPLSAGWVLSATYPISRKPDLAMLVAKAQELRDAGIVIESVIKHTPELITSAYRTLSETQRHLMDQVMDIKPGSPQMELKLPKRAAPVTNQEQM